MKLQLGKNPIFLTYPPNNLFEASFPNQINIDLQNINKTQLSWLGKNNSIQFKIWHSNAHIAQYSLLFLILTYPNHLQILHTIKFQAKEFYTQK